MDCTSKDTNLFDCVFSTPDQSKIHQKTPTSLILYFPHLISPHFWLAPSIPLEPLGWKQLIKLCYITMLYFSVLWMLKYSSKIAKGLYKDYLDGQRTRSTHPKHHQTFIYQSQYSQSKCDNASKAIYDTKTTIRTPR